MFIFDVKIDVIELSEEYALRVKVISSGNFAPNRPFRALLVVRKQCCAIIHIFADDGGRVGCDD